MVDQSGEIMLVALSGALVPGAIFHTVAIVFVSLRKPL